MTAVVAGCEDAAALAAARALRQSGAEVIGVSGREGAPTCSSRLWSRVVVFPDLHGPDAARRLLEVAGTLQHRPVLFVTRDDLVRQVSLHRDELAGCYDLVLPPAAAVELLLDKDAFYDWALTQGLPVPATRRADRVELAAALQGGGGPYILKPPCREDGWTAASPDVKAWLLRTTADLAAVPDAVWALPETPLVQDWIAGPDSAITFCLVAYGRDGRLLAWQTGRKLVQWPRGTGSTAVCETTQDPELLALTRTVFERVGLRGLGSLEVKRDSRSGELLLVEPTVGRLDLQSGLAELGGQQLLLRAALDASGAHQLPAAHASRRACLVVEPLAAQALRGGVRGSGGLRPVLSAAVRARGLRGAYLHLDDLPVARQALREVRRSEPSAAPTVAVSSEPRPTASVVICTYTAKRWDDLVAAVASVQDQTVPPLELIVVVDHEPALAARARAELPGAQVVESTGPQGLSGARNTGVAQAQGRVVVFLDDDARAAPTWLEELLEPYRDPRVMAVGGGIEPAWTAERPGWFPPVFEWVVGCSYEPGRDQVRQVRNPTGANMSFRREVLSAVGGFRDGLGRAAAGLAGCEETELSIRASQLFPSQLILMVPSALVHHRVPPERTSWRYFARRCWDEGRSKAAVATLVGSHDALSSERSYVARALPRSVLRAARSRGSRLDALGQVAAVLLGLTAAVGGFAEARLRSQGAPR